MTTLAYHGTDRMDFDRFDVAEARVYNVGPHVGTRAAAESRIAKDPSLYYAFNQKLNAELRSLSQKLGYDGFVYTNRFEDGESAADSYCVFDDSQVAVASEEMVKYAMCRARCVA